MRDYSNSIADAVRAFLDEEGFRYFFSEERGQFVFDIHMNGKIKFYSYRIIVNEDSYTVNLRAPVGADAEDAEEMTQMESFVNRANYGLRYGFFELDVSDGELSLKFAVDCEDMEPTQAMVRNSIILPDHLMNKYIDGICAITFGKKTADEAINMCESMRE